MSDFLRKGPKSSREGQIRILRVRIFHSLRYRILRLVSCGYDDVLVNKNNNDGPRCSRRPPWRSTDTAGKPLVFQLQGLQPLK